jgi:hypothetical protein
LLRVPIEEGANLRLCTGRGRQLKLPFEFGDARGSIGLGVGAAPPECKQTAPARLRPISLERLKGRVAPPISKPVPFAGEVNAHFLENVSSYKFLRSHSREPLAIHLMVVMLVRRQRF